MKASITHFITIIAVFLSCMALPAWAEDDPQSVINYRQKVMKSLGGHNGAIGSIVRNRVSYDSHLELHAQAIVDVSKTIISLFPPGSDFGDTQAKLEVWDKRADFEQAAKDAEQAAEAFLKAVKSKTKDLGPAYKNLGESCKGCHKTFREKD